MTEADAAQPDGHSPLDALLGATPRRVLRHWLTLLLLAFAALGALIFFVRFVNGDDSPYYSAPVERGDLVPLLSERGVVRGSGEVTISAPLDGRLAWVTGKTDGEVSKGELLAKLDAEELRGRIVVARANLAAADATLQGARVAAQNAAARLSRFEVVWRRSNGRAPSLNEMDSARAEARRTALAVEAAASALEAARVELANDRARVAKVEVRAPIDGLLVLRRVETGQSAHEGQPLFALATRLSPLSIVVPLAPPPGAPITPGMPARVRLDAMPDRVQAASFSRVIAGVPPQSRAVGLFAIPNPEPGIKPGMPGMVEVELPRRSNVLLVPDAALAFEPGNEPSPGRRQARIYLLADDGEPKRVYVTLGGSDGKRTEVFATGIRPGDQVITGWRNNPASASGSGGQ